MWLILQEKKVPWVPMKGLRILAAAAFIIASWSIQPVAADVSQDLDLGQPGLTEEGSTGSDQIEAGGDLNVGSDEELIAKGRRGGAAMRAPMSRPRAVSRPRPVSRPPMVSRPRPVSRPASTHRAPSTPRTVRAAPSAAHSRPVRATTRPVTRTQPRSSYAASSKPTKTNQSQKSWKPLSDGQYWYPSGLTASKPKPTGSASRIPRNQGKVLSPVKQPPPKQGYGGKYGPSRTNVTSSGSRRPPRGGRDVSMDTFVDRTTNAVADYFGRNTNQPVRGPGKTNVRTPVNQSGRRGPVYGTGTRNDPYRDYKTYAPPSGRRTGPAGPIYGTGTSTDPFRGYASVPETSGDPEESSVLPTPETTPVRQSSRSGQHGGKLTPTTPNSRRSGAVQVPPGTVDHQNMGPRTLSAEDLLLSAAGHVMQTPVGLGFTGVSASATPSLPSTSNANDRDIQLTGGGYITARNLGTTEMDRRLEEMLRTTAEKTRDALTDALAITGAVRDGSGTVFDDIAVSREFGGLKGDLIDSDVVRAIHTGLTGMHDRITHGQIIILDNLVRPGEIAVTIASENFRNIHVDGTFGGNELAERVATFAHEMTHLAEVEGGLSTDDKTYEKDLDYSDKADMKSTGDSWGRFVRGAGEHRQTTQTAQEVVKLFGQATSLAGVPGIPVAGKAVTDTATESLAGKYYSPFRKEKEQRPTPVPPSRSRGLQE